MTPADITNEPDLAIYQGAKWEHTLTFTQTVGGAPVDLSGRTFVLTVSKTNAAKTFLFNGVAALTNDGTDGKVSVLLTAAQTDELNLGEVNIGMRDDLNNPYLTGVAPVLYFAPAPA